MAVPGEPSGAEGDIGDPQRSVHAGMSLDEFGDSINGGDAGLAEFFVAGA
jgi:hypothetical protein